jgi:hypothetical protein
MNQFRWWISLTATLCVVVLASAEPAADPPKPTPTPDELQKQIDALKQKVGVLEKRINDDALTLVDILRDIKEQLQQLRAEMKSAAKMPGQTRTSFAPLAPGMGRLRVMNEYNTQISVIVNGTGYKLTAGEGKDFDLKPGAFTYQVLDAQDELQSRSVNLGEIITVRVHTPR